MSVSLMISNPQTEVEESVNIPISTERVFQDYWMPIIEKLDLKWARCFQSGIEIEVEDLVPVLTDLRKIRLYVLSYMEGEQKEQIINRIDNLCEELNKIFDGRRPDIKVYIG